MAVGGWIVSEYRNMFDVVAMVPEMRRKPARLCWDNGAALTRWCFAGSEVSLVAEKMIGARSVGSY
jgi:hypothetical protein